jgi:hypothetical protein
MRVDGNGGEAVKRQTNVNPNQKRVSLMCTPLLKLLKAHVLEASWFARVHSWGSACRTFHASHNLLQSTTCQTSHASFSLLVTQCAHDATCTKHLHAHPKNGLVQDNLHCICMA